MITFVRVNNDINGNPRYVCHFSDLLNKNEYATALNKVSIDETYNLALKKAKLYVSSIETLFNAVEIGRASCRERVSNFV